jgi:hypothetical protein
VDAQLFGREGFDHLWSTKAVGPDFDFRIHGAIETQQFKRENNPLKKKITGPQAAQDHHAIAGVSIAAGCVIQSMAIGNQNHQLTNARWGSVTNATLSEFPVFLRFSHKTVCVNSLSRSPLQQLGPKSAAPA